MTPNPFHAVVRQFEGLRDLRHGLQDWLDHSAVDPTASMDLVLAVNEVATNAIEAAEDGVATVEAVTDDVAVQVVVANAGAWVEGPMGVEPRDVLSERGRGVELTRAIVDSLTFNQSNDRTVATIVKTTGSARSATADHSPRFDRR